MTLPKRTIPSPTLFAANIGAQAAQPTSGSVELRSIYEPKTGQFVLRFTLKAARIPVTDATTSGSSGSLKLFDFVKQVIAVGPSRQNYTAFAEGSALTTAAGDAAFVLACGSVAADAGDGALTGTEVDFAAATATLTNSGGTTTGSKLSAVGTTAPLDGSGTAKSIYLNWSGTAATIDANSTIDVTGDIWITGQMLGA